MTLLAATRTAVDTGPSLRRSSGFSSVRSSHPLSVERRSVAAAKILDVKRSPRGSPGRDAGRPCSNRAGSGIPEPVREPLRPRSARRDRLAPLKQNQRRHGLAPLLPCGINPPASCGPSRAIEFRSSANDAMLGVTIRCRRRASIDFRHHLPLCDAERVEFLQGQRNFRGPRVPFASRGSNGRLPREGNIRSTLPRSTSRPSSTARSSLQSRPIDEIARPAPARTRRYIENFGSANSSLYMSL